MNPLAIELNELLKDTVAHRMLSDFGKRFYFPKGIVSQSGEAKKQAHRFNATVGMAYKQNVADQRESPALTILEKLDAAAAGAEAVLGTARVTAAAD